MPTSVTGISISSGFTLLEVLVTVVLIGIIASFAVLAVRGNDPHDRLAREAQRLHARLELEQQEAMLRGELRGVLFTRTGYAFLVETQEDEWAVPLDSSLPQSYTLSRGVEMALSVDERRVVLAETAGQPLRPQVLLPASGELMPFQVTLGITADRGERYAVGGDIAGRVRLERLDPL
jgi:general secretion pathway protein H